MTCCDFRTWRIDIEMARVGTSSSRANHPSPNCCACTARRARPRERALSVSKSAGGSLNAGGCSPDTDNDATSTGASVMSAATRSHSARGSAASPSIRWKTPGCTRSMMRSVRNLRKLAGCDEGSPMYSSRWKNTRLCPVDPGRLGECVEELELRGACRSHDARLAALGYRGLDQAGSLRSRLDGQRLLRLEESGPPCFLLGESNGPILTPRRMPAPARRVPRRSGACPTLPCARRH